MSPKKPDPEKLNRVLTEQRAYIEEREKGYRERSLKLYPWIFGRCTREFVRANLRELTVHHIDHNHAKTPPDGSNWELLCVYCHDEEHSKFTNLVRYGSTSPGDKTPATFNPFADLKEIMKKADE
jgi:hypothetical protein